MSDDLFLPGVDVAAVRAAMAKAGGNELTSGKFASPESSAALAVNTFGWFIGRPSKLPPLPGLHDLDWPAVSVEVERCLRFPWSGGRHPWLDAVVETRRALIGVESKRFEPFRDAKQVSLSAAYDRPVWGEGMAPFEALRDALRSGLRYVHLDAAQLLKHAFGIVTQARVQNKAPILYYLFAEPSVRAGRAIQPTDIAMHRQEIADFGERVRGARVRFVASSYTEYLGAFAGDTAIHAAAVLARYSP